MIHLAAVWDVQAALTPLRTFFRSAACVIGLYAVLVLSWRAQDRRWISLIPPMMVAAFGCLMALSTALSDEAFSKVLEVLYVVATIGIAVCLALVVSLIANRALRLCKTTLHKDRV